MTTARLLSSLLLAAVAISSPPPAGDKVAMARYVVHYTDWASIATISTRKGIEGFPFSNLRTIADGVEPESSTGVPYYYTSDMEMSTIDNEADTAISMSITLMETGYCQDQGWIAMDPRCPRLILTGNAVKLEDGSAEQDFARNALFTRYPEMEFWPADHGWHFFKVAPKSIVLLDAFGGVADIGVEEYLAAGTPDH